MIYQATKKVPGGKLLRVLIVGNNNKIRKITVTGDFFLHPEDVLGKIETSLIGKNFDTSIDDYAEDIHEILYQTQANFVGVSPQDIAETIYEAVHVKA